MKRYRQVKKTCPKCNHNWADELSGVMNSLKKVDFFWINRDQKSFEWFVSLLSLLEMEMTETEGESSIIFFETIAKWLNQKGGGLLKKGGFCSIAL